MIKTATQEEVKAAFEYKDGALFWKNHINPKNIGKDKSRVIKKTDNLSYKIIHFKGKDFLVHRLIFLYHHGYMPVCIDHEDGNGLNNDIDNLRAATFAQNMSNRKRKACKTKYRGVNRTRALEGSKAKKWAVFVRCNNVIHYIGRFHGEEEAALAYNKAAVRLHGEFAQLNIIEPINQKS